MDISAFGKLVGLFGDVQQVAPQRLQLLGADAPRYQTVGFFNQRLDGLLQSAARVRQADDDAAAIRLAVFPDDQRFFLQTAHNAGNGGGVQTQVLGQLGGSLLVLVPQAFQQRVLDRRDIELLKLLFEAQKHGVLHVGQHEVDTFIQLH